MSYQPPPRTDITVADAVEAYKKAGSVNGAAKLLRCTRVVIENRLRANTETTHMPPPDGHHVRGVSTLYDGEGNVRAQWVKTNADEARLQQLREAFLAELTAEVKGLASPVPAPKPAHDEMLSAYVIGDAHFGMRAHAEETGEADFDLKIAERELKAAISYLVRTAPKSRYGLLVDVGDFMHVDNRKNVTPQSGNMLDVDTRYHKLIRVVVLTYRYAIEQLLRKHERVKVIVCPGNHNPDSASWVALALSLFYEREKRVEIDTSPSAYFYHRYGRNLIGVTHGDRCKFADLISIMAADRPKDWGETEHRHFFTGHIHHTKHQEFRGGFAESFNTLAPGDAWHAASGYRSKRQMQRVDFHKDNGIVSRFFCALGMLDLVA